MSTYVSPIHEFFATASIPEIETFAQEFNLSPSAWLAYTSRERAGTLLAHVVTKLGAVPTVADAFTSSECFEVVLRHNPDLLAAFHNGKTLPLPPGRIDVDPLDGIVKVLTACPEGMPQEDHQQLVESIVRHAVAFGRLDALREALLAGGSPVDAGHALIAVATLVGMPRHVEVVEVLDAILTYGSREILTATPDGAELPAWESMFCSLGTIRWGTLRTNPEEVLERFMTAGLPVLPTTLAGFGLMAARARRAAEASPDRATLLRQALLMHDHMESPAMVRSLQAAGAVLDENTVAVAAHRGPFTLEAILGAGGPVRALLKDGYPDLRPDVLDTVLNHIDPATLNGPASEERPYPLWATLTYNGSKAGEDVGRAKALFARMIAIGADVTRAGIGRHFPEDDRKAAVERCFESQDHVRMYVEDIELRATAAEALAEVAAQNTMPAQPRARKRL